MKTGGRDALSKASQGSGPGSADQTFKQSIISAIRNLVERWNLKKRLRPKVSFARCLDSCCSFSWRFSNKNCQPIPSHLLKYGIPKTQCAIRVRLLLLFHLITLDLNTCQHLLYREHCARMSAPWAFPGVKGQERWPWSRTLICPASVLPFLTYSLHLEPFEGITRTKANGIEPCLLHWLRKVLKRWLSFRSH